MIVIQFFTVCGSILVKYPRVLSVSITHSHVLHVTFTLLYEMFKEWYFLLLVHVVLPVFVLGMHHFKLCDYANLCVSQTSLVLVYFALWLGDAKDDAKLKKCVSTRYATVLILLTVKCEYYYKKNPFLRIFYVVLEKVAMHQSILHCSWVTCLETYLPCQCPRMLKCYRNWLRDF